MFNKSAWFKFCGSELWDSNLTWHTEIPDFTRCFQKTFLIWIPCLFILFFLPFELRKHRDANGRIPWRIFNIIKILNSLILAILSVINFSYALNLELEYEEKVPLADYVSPFILFTALVSSVLLQLLYKKQGVTSSAVLFTFWFTLAVFGSVQFRSEILKALQNESYMYTYLFISYIIYFSLVIIQFIFNCFADTLHSFSKFSTDKNPCPEFESSILSQLLFSWFDKMAWNGFKKPLEFKDLWPLHDENAAFHIFPKFEKYWKTNHTRHKNDNSILKNELTENLRKLQFLLPLCKAFGPPFLFGTFFKIINDCFIFVNPLILKRLIGFVQSDEYDWRGYFYVFLKFFITTGQTLLMNQYFYYMMVVGARSRVAIMSAVYRKSLKLSNNARKIYSTGEITNLMSVDSQRFIELTVYLNMIWSAPLHILIALYFLWDLLGVSIFAGMGVMVILIPINGYVSNQTKKLQMKQMNLKDERLKITNEVLSSLKVLKLYAWEPCFEKRIMDIRTDEVEVLKKTAYFNAAISFMWSCAPFLVALVTLGSYALLGNDLTASTTFVSLSYFNILRVPMKNIPQMITVMIQAGVSIGRLDKFLGCDELDRNSVCHEEKGAGPVQIENGFFSWGSSDKPILENINMFLRHGQLAAVVGSVGAGKSSLISALLGEMDKLSGRVNTCGSVAYVPQQAWIKNAALRQNILFGRKLNHGVYSRVLHACALKPDLKTLTAGDLTEIGEKGINLSGGQKQRISLARAVYANADLYFLDDPLSAVDAQAGRHIFNNVIGPMGILRHKSRLFITHNVNYLTEADVIFVMKNGKISEVGTYHELLRKKGEFAEFIVSHLNEDFIANDLDFEEIKSELNDTIDADTVKEIQIRRSSFKSAAENIVQPLSDDDFSDFEDKDEMIGKKIYEDRILIDKKHKEFSGLFFKDLKDGGRKYSKSIIAEMECHRKYSEDHGFISDEEVAMLPSLGSNDDVFVETTQSKLIQDERAQTGKVKWRVYCHYFRSIGLWISLGTLIINISNQAFSVTSNFWLSHWSTASKNGNLTSEERNHYLGVYAALGFGQVLGSYFFELLPRLGAAKASHLFHAYMLKSILRAPIQFIETTPIGRVLMRFSGDLEAVDGKLSYILSDMYFFFLQAISVILVISYTTPIFIAVVIPIGIVYFFIQRYYIATSRQLKRLEASSRSPIFSHFGESLSGVQTIRAYSLQNQFIQESQDRMDVNQACFYPKMIANRWLGIRLEMIGNLIIFFAALFAVINRKTIDAGFVGLSITYAMQITQILQWLVRMTTDVETNIVAVERIKEYGEIQQEADWENISMKPEKNWPQKGDLEFKNYEFRYREGMDLVLQDIDLQISGGEKIGIVGRTGAGKSSLTLALFRIVEPANGTIIIDGIDVAKIGLHDLRTRLTIIPQDPILFCGTIRFNLDPFSNHTDQEIWQALENAHLKNFVSETDLGLQYEIQEGGENLSVGQRQLMCLARALLRKTKLLILDEATAAVDIETDVLIQKTVRDKFKDCTVLTIAHRLNTILDSNRVVVLDRGKIIEMDTPKNLLTSSNSVFAAMAKDSGIVMESK